MASVGIEGTVLQRRAHFTARGFSGFNAYFMAGLHAYFKGYARAVADITVDGRKIQMENLLSLMVVKQPYYGFGMKVVPRACFDDGFLHFLVVNSGFFESVFGLITAFTVGNHIGHYLTGRHMSVKINQPTTVQIDGNVGWSADSYTFSVLPEKLRIKC